MQNQQTQVKHRQSQNPEGKGTTHLTIDSESGKNSLAIKEAVYYILISTIVLELLPYLVDNVMPEGYSIHPLNPEKTYYLKYYSSYMGERVVLLFISVSLVLLSAIKRRLVPVILFSILSGAFLMLFLNFWLYYVKPFKDIGKGFFELIDFYYKEKVCIHIGSPSNCYSAIKVWNYATFIALKGIGYFTAFKLSEETAIELRYFCLSLVVYSCLDMAFFIYYGYSDLINLYIPLAYAIMAAYKLAKKFWEAKGVVFR